MTIKGMKCPDGKIVMCGDPLLGYSSILTLQVSALKKP
jgi:hypothetical protein